MPQRNALQEKLLVIDKNAEQLPPLIARLGARRFDAKGVSNPDEALGHAAHDEPSIVVIGDLPPDWARTSYCRALRKLLSSSQTLILMSPPPENASAARHLLLAACDGFIATPLSADGIASTVAQLSNSHRALRRNIKYGDLSLDLDQMKLNGFGKSLALGPQMMDILKLFLREPCLVHSRDEILDALGKRQKIHVSSVNVYVRRLRLAMMAAGMPDVIESVRSLGYRMQLP